MRHVSRAASEHGRGVIQKSGIAFFARADRDSLECYPVWGRDFVLGQERSFRGRESVFLGMVFYYWVFSHVG